MGRDSRKDGRRETTAERYGPESIELGIRERVRDVIQQIVAEEVEAALGAKPSERVGAARHGYRHGHRERSLTTSVGATTIDMPRARVLGVDRSSREWQSRRSIRETDCGQHCAFLTRQPGRCPGLPNHAPSDASRLALLSEDAAQAKTLFLRMLSETGMRSKTRSSCSLVIGNTARRHVRRQWRAVLRRQGSA